MHVLRDRYADPILDRMPGREIIIDNRNNSTIHEDYQVELEIDPKRMFFEAQDSLRFIDENLQIIDHWNESFPNKEWIEVPKIAASGMCVLRMINPLLSTSSASNGENTFEFFDDFSLIENVFSATKSLVSSNGLGLNPHNVAGFINRALWTHGSNQYIAYISNGGDVMVGKRSLPGGNWTNYDTGFNVDTADAHEVVSLGIDTDGYIHISYGMHCDPLEYARSDNAEDPSSFTVQSMVGSDESAVTYPQFFVANNILLFSYRGGCSDSAQILNKYNVSTKAWSSVFHPLILGSASAVVYVDSFIVDDSENIHVSFMWRTSFSNPIESSDYSYAYSSDSGLTWKKTDGSAYSMPITQTNAEKFLSGMISGLINQNHIDADSNGHPHIAYWKLAGGHLNYFHTWHNGTSWQTMQITAYTHTPTSIYTGVTRDIARPGIIIDRTIDRVFIFTRQEDDGYIELFKADSPFTSWTHKKLGNEKWGCHEFGGFDYGKWHNDHDMYLMASRVTGSNPESVYILKSDLERTIDADVYDSDVLADKWVVPTGSVEPTVSDSIATFHEVSAVTRQMYSKVKHLTYGRKVEALMKYDGSVTTMGGYLCCIGNNPVVATDNIQLTSVTSITETYFRCVNDGTPTPNHYAEQFPISYERMGISLLSGESKAWRGGIVKSTINTNVPDADLYVGFREWNEGYVYVDWVFVRKYSSPEPTAEVGVML